MINFRVKFRFRNLEYINMSKKMIVSLTYSSMHAPNTEYKVTSESLCHRFQLVPNFIACNSLTSNYFETKLSIPGLNRGKYLKYAMI